MSIRTETHYYPAEEVREMDSFYHGKRCVIEQRLHGTAYAHMLSAALPASNEHVCVKPLSVENDADDEQTAYRDA